MSALPGAAAADDPATYDGTDTVVPEDVAVVEPAQPVAALADLPDHGMVVVTVDHRQILLCRLGGDVFAVAAICSHAGAPLVEGRLDGAHVQCPWHRVRFDVRTGARVTVPACADLRAYRTEVRDGTVWVSMGTG